AAQAFVQDCAALFSIQHHRVSCEDLLNAQIQPISWWLSGITTLSDWLGSNQQYFKFCRDRMSLPDYWKKHALPQAERALAQTSLLPAAAAQQDFYHLFPHIRQATPLQQHCLDLQMPTSPQLFILEDLTGAGKTEAALALTQRLMAAGQAQGFYFALPTMATSNAMFERIGEVYRQFFSQPVSCILAHSLGWLKTQPQQTSIWPEDEQSALDYQSGEQDTASAQVNRWFQDNRKKALLAHVGVGTIDQALLAILHSRHNTLRLLGLHGKVLLVDEVHACDAYVLSLLEKLLYFHAYAGGSAILLSATLPQTQRQRLITAYRQGREKNTGQSYAAMMKKQDYPLLTQFGEQVSGHLQETFLAISARQQHKGFRIHHVSTDAGVLAHLRQGQAHCACWIRNTVKDALLAYQQLLAAGFEEDKLHLFHARFTPPDRERKE
ncbi:CRISPR-associated helicase Cas3', partial [Candidatus Venteria ishoeyi]|uniref:CRISPR-associated helicase Cas3' n=1 Tax=Candidatus Venteria ishoeyi TaxID=1899563 RepID=UPI0015ABBA01